MTARARREFTLKVKNAAFDRCKGHCEMDGCGLELQTGRFTYDHRVPDWIGGDATLENCQVICRACDKAKTAKDQGDIARVRGVRDRHIGAHRSRNPLPGGRDSPLKRKIGGGVVPR